MKYRIYRCAKLAFYLFMTKGKVPFCQRRRKKGAESYRLCARYCYLQSALSLFEDNLLCSAVLVSDDVHTLYESVDLSASSVVDGCYLRVS